VKDNHGIPFLGVMPKEYDPQLIGQMFRVVELALKQTVAIGPIHVTTINVSELPTSATGLRSGDVYNNLGTLKVVP
jgi:hypothetical protein